MLVRVVNRAGYLSTAVENGAKAFELLRDGGFDLAILDVQMPGMSAVEIARRLRLENNPTLLLILTADATSKTAQQCHQEGAQLVLTKPIGLDELLVNISALLNVGRLHTNRHTEPRGSTSGLIDQETLSALAKTFSWDFVRKLLADFSIQTEAAITKIEEAWLARDFHSLEELLHKLEGSAGTMGAKTLADMARDARNSLQGSAAQENAFAPSSLKENLRSTMVALDNEITSRLFAENKSKPNI